jgi:cell division protein FtsN
MQIQQTALPKPHERGVIRFVPCSRAKACAKPVLTRRRQQGGTLLGIVIGGVLGLGIALGVAIYVSKVPVPFLNRYQTRAPGLDAAEAKKNLDWNPNAAFAPKADAKMEDGSASLPAKGGGSANAVAPVTVAPAGGANRGSAAASSDPLGDLARSRSGASTSQTPPRTTASVAPSFVAPVAGATDPFTYFVQAGAFRANAEADAQRARLAIMGWEARVTEREQAGRTIYRVRVGPFTRRDDAEQLKDKLDAAGMESSLVRAQR